MAGRAQAKPAGAGSPKLSPRLLFRFPLLVLPRRGMATGPLQQLSRGQEAIPVGDLPELRNVVNVGNRLFTARFALNLDAEGRALIINSNANAALRLYASSSATAGVPP
jgi:hypothetical protein